MDKRTDFSEAASENIRQLIDEALCRSVLYEAMSLALHYPTAETCSRLFSQEAGLALHDAASLLSATEQARAAAVENITLQDVDIDLVSRVDHWIETFGELTPELLLTCRGRLFGHTARGAVCPYETEYGQEGLFQQPRQLAEIAGFYQAFGLKPRSTERERPDHVSCELEFLVFLSRKEAFALESGDQEMFEETRKASRLFLKDHLGRFGPAFAKALHAQDGDDFFGRLGDLLLDFVRYECRRLRLEAGPALLQLRSNEDDQAPMACGGGDSELVQLENPST